MLAGAAPVGVGAVSEAWAHENTEEVEISETKAIRLSDRRNGDDIGCYLVMWIVITTRLHARQHEGPVLEQSLMP